MDFTTSLEMKKVLSQLRRGSKELRVSGLWGAACALFLSSLVNLRRGLMVIVPDEDGRIEIEEDLATFGVPVPVLSFAPLETDKRLDCLYRLLTSRRFLLVTDPKALGEEIVSPDYFFKHSSVLKINDTLHREKFLQKLVASAYEGSPMIERRGEFSIRGGIIDLWSPQETYPVRIELRGEKVSSLRNFDPSSQRSIKKIKKIEIIPFSCQGKATLLDYLPKDTLVVAHETSGQLISSVPNRTPLAPSGPRGPRALDLSAYQLISLLPFARDGAVNFDTRPMENFHSKIDLLRERIRQWQKESYHVVIFSDNRQQKVRYQELLKGVEPVEIKVGTLSSGFLSPAVKLALLTDAEIFGRYRQRKYLSRPGAKEGAPFSGVFELEEGDYAVHQDYGIGIYEGLKRLKVADGEMDFVSLRYARSGRLYIPTDESHLLSKYIGTEGYRPKLYRLGGASWERIKERVRERIKELAEDLLNLYASRQAFKGFSFSKDDQWQRQFDSAFIYPETPDQARAIEEVKKDMEDPHPMDRLICGDVGYGKTEIAMRAAFKTVIDTKQVALLTPTTVLAQQHYHTFRERFAAWPVSIESLSRFKSKIQQKKIIENLKKGLVDIIIGTHRLLQKDVDFKDLGLVIIDEEQRFGVRHKERLKTLKKLVDVMTLSATPIPRTLHCALAGIWDMSLVNTPPEGRLPIATYVGGYDERILKEAVKLELARRGQVYFVHNRIEEIPDLVRRVEKLFPRAKVAGIHGRMSEKILEKVMLLFTRREIDILVSTVIVELGLDNPDVNTLIVTNAQDFGLSTLYQLRGRVGRGRNKAYTYFFYPRGYHLSSVQEKRLATIAHFTDLGSGFKIAMKDLEIRGAGNILGPEQSGYIIEIGFELYCKLLEEAVERLKGCEPAVRVPAPKITLDLKAYLPEEFIPAQPQRITLYKRMASACRQEEIGDLKRELEDRFGPLPPEAKNLLEIMRLKLIAQRLGIIEITKDRAQVVIRWKKSEEVPENIGRLIKGKISQKDGSVSFYLKGKSIRALSNILQKLMGRATL
jgi:transcription-repair coupling factor (superfamily II helicase)